MPPSYFRKWIEFFKASSGVWWYWIRRTRRNSLKNLYERLDFNALHNLEYALQSPLQRNKPYAVQETDQKHLQQLKKAQAFTHIKDETVLGNQHSFNIENHETFAFDFRVQPFSLDSVFLATFIGNALCPKMSCDNHSRKNAVILFGHKCTGYPAVPAGNRRRTPAVQDSLCI